MRKAKLRAGEMELWVKRWLHKCRDLSSDPYDPQKSGFSNTICKDFNSEMGGVDKRLPGSSWAS